MTNFKKYVIEDSLTIGKVFFVLVFLCVLIYVWFWSNASWLHPELLGTAAYVWGMPDLETLTQLLRKVFDWKAFDPNVNRVRPLNDVVEVIDAIARPFLTRIIGPHSSFTPSSLITMILAPSFLYAYLRRVLNNSWAPIILCMIFIASTGMLSVTVSYIRPAKKLNMIFLCAALYFGQRQAEKGNMKDFLALYGILIASFFSDELGLINFFICAFLFWQSIFTTRLLKKRLLYLSLPFVFLIITKWGLPTIYKIFSVHGAWDALNDPKKFSVFGYLLNPQFYFAAFIQTARSFLSTIGIYKHVAWTELTALLVLVIIPMCQAFRFRGQGLLVILKDPLIVATTLIFLSSFYATLLDWYPFPYEISYLGSFNYYYHSSIVVMVIIWIGFLWKNITDFSKNRSLLSSQVYGLFFLAGTLIIGANFFLFQQVNQLVQIIHLYPFTQMELETKLKKIGADQSVGSLNVAFSMERERIKERFEKKLKLIFQERWKQNGFYQTFQFVIRNPIMSNAHINHLTRAYYPFQNLSIIVDEMQCISHVTTEK